MPFATTELRQVCFVDMPFGRKSSASFLGEIDFDDVYVRGIKPAIERVGLLCIRGDEEIQGGIVHYMMFARLVLSEFVVADLSMGNPNVFYELGIRHATRPQTTIPIFSTESSLPFDVGLIRAIPYELSNGHLSDDAACALQEKLTARLKQSLDEEENPDSPIFQLLKGYEAPRVSPSVKAAIEASVTEVRRFRAALKAAGKDGATLIALERSLDDLKTVDIGLLSALLNAYYSSGNYAQAFALYKRMPAAARHLPDAWSRSAMMLLRTHRVDEAFEVLEDAQRVYGQHPRLLGMRGRIFMELYRRSRGDADDTAEILRRAIEALTKAFVLDPTDTYLGINALRALMSSDNAEHREQYQRILPVVRFAAERRESINSDDPWAVASELELAVMSRDWDGAARATSKLCALPLDMSVISSLRSELEVHLSRLDNSDDMSGALAAIIKKLDSRSSQGRW